MCVEQRSETVVIKHPSDKFVTIFNQLKAEKDKKREELLKKDKFTFSIQL